MKPGLTATQHGDTGMWDEPLPWLEFLERNGATSLDLALGARSARDAAGIDAQYLDLVGRLTRAAGRDVHLVLLDSAEPVLGRQAFLGARVLFDREPSRTADLLERILVAYFDGEYHRRMRAEALDHRRESRRG